MSEAVRAGLQSHQRCTIIEALPCLLWILIVWREGSHGLSLKELSSIQGEDKWPRREDPA